MTKEDFVKFMYDGGLEIIQDCVRSLRSPPGRVPLESDRRRSAWFLALSVDDQSAVEDVIRVAVQSTMMSVFCELDGVGGIPGTREKGMLELRYIEGDTSKLLNDPTEEELHDLYRSMIEW